MATTTTNKTVNGPPSDMSLRPSGALRAKNVVDSLLLCAPQRGQAKRGANRVVFKSIDNLGLNPDHYHQIEDFISSWLLTHTEMVPRCYVIVLAGMMRKRVLNARVRGTTLDSRHTKNVVCVLMVILIYLHKMGMEMDSSDMEVSGEKRGDKVIHELLILFHYYYQLVREFIERDREVFSGHVRKSLSLASKLKGADSKVPIDRVRSDRASEGSKVPIDRTRSDRASAGSGSGSGSDSDDGLKKRAFQYDFVRENFDRIREYLALANASAEDTLMREEIYQQIIKNHIIQSILPETPMVKHSTYFPLSIDALNTRYKEYTVQMYLDDAA